MREIATRPVHPLLQAVREVLAVLLGGVLVAIAWLIVVQEAYKQGLTGHEFNRGLGLLLGGEGEQVPRWGFYGTVTAGIVLALVYALVSHLTARRWYLLAIPFGLVVFVAWGVVFCPLVGGTTDEVPAGLFGREADVWAPISAFLAAFACSFSLARVHSLVRSAQWWEPKHFDLRESLEMLFTEEVDSGGEPPGGRRDVEIPDVDVGRHPPLSG
jgi:hypothetical protein